MRFRNMFTEEFFGVNGATTKPSRESVVDTINVTPSTTQQTTPDVGTNVVETQEPTFTVEEVGALIDTVRGNDQPTPTYDPRYIPPRTVIVQPEIITTPVDSSGIPNMGGGGFGGSMVEEDLTEEMPTETRLKQPNRLKQVLVILLVGVVAYLLYKKFLSKK